MLVKVSIENFKSFDSKTEFTMISSNKIRSHRDHKIEIKGTASSAKSLPSSIARFSAALIGPK